MAMGSTQPKKEMTIGILSEGTRRPERKADSLTAICGPDCLQNVGPSTSHNSIGLQGSLKGKLYLFYGL
jgi:hypothetical protein